MDKIECVLDTELFEKFSPDKRELSERSESGALKEEYANELKCLSDFLSAIQEAKCIACYNDEILEEYAAWIEKLPEDPHKIGEALSTIISFDSFSTEVIVTPHDIDIIKTRIEGTALEKKLQYMVVARSRHSRLIVSTCNDIEGCYRGCSRILMSLKIRSKNACDAFEEIYKMGGIIRHGD